MLANSDATSISSDTDADASDHAGSFAPNPLGKNQFDCPSKWDPGFRALLRAYHRHSTNRFIVRDLLETEHGIVVSDRTVSRRWQEMGLKASGATEANLPREDVVNLVREQVGMDRDKNKGQLTIKKEIALRTGIHLKRTTVATIQRELDPDAADARQPTARRIVRVPLTSAGPNEVWCCDGHDKLLEFGFAIWGIRDKFSRKWLGLWVMPSNRFAVVVAHYWLTLVRDFGGMPIQTSTDCGTENTLIHGLARSLRDSFAPGVSQLPAHIFLRSVHHTPIERGWYDFRRDFGNNVRHYWDDNNGTYNPDLPLHRYLARWLWPPVIQFELDKFRQMSNSRRVRKQRNKILPSGVSPDVAYTLPERWDGHDCLQWVAPHIIQEILDDIEDERKVHADWDIPEEHATRFEQLLPGLGIRNRRNDVTLQNIWVVFNALLRLM